MHKLILAMFLSLGTYTFAAGNPSEIQELPQGQTNIIEHNELDDIDHAITRHTIKNVFIEWDPYEGNYIYEYTFMLDDDSFWLIPWDVYEINELALTVGGEVEIASGNDDKYFMIAPTLQAGESKSILFRKCTWQNNCYYTGLFVK